MWVWPGAQVHAPASQVLGKSPVLGQVQSIMVTVPPVCVQRSLPASTAASLVDPPVPPSLALVEEVELDVVEVEWLVLLEEVVAVPPVAVVVDAPPVLLPPPPHAVSAAVPWRRRAVTARVPA